MPTFQLGQRVKIIGTAERKRERIDWSAKNTNNPYPEVKERWPELKAMPDNGDHGMLRTSFIETTTTATEGVIIGARNVQQGLTYDESWPERNCFLPCETTRVWLVAFHLRRKPIMCFDHQIAAFPMPETITVPMPHIPHPGFHTQGHFMRTAARNIKNDHPAGGYNVTTAVIKLLTDTANAMEAAK